MSVSINPAAGSTAAAPSATAAADLIDGSRRGGLLDIDALAAGLAASGSPDLARDVRGQLPLLEAVRLDGALYDLGVGRAGVLLGDVGGLAPGPVGEVVDTVGQTADPVADPLYQTGSEKEHIQQAETVVDRFMWEARGQADLDVALSPYLRTDRLPGDAKYAAEVRSPVEREG